MATLVAGIGDLVASKSQSDELKTFALGSCVAVIVRDPTSFITGLLHIALPDNAVNLDKAALTPAYFANTGIPLLFNKMKELGLNRMGNHLMIKLAGGANISDENNVFNIGKRNILAVKKILWQMGMGPVAEDLGGNISRTVTVNVNTGKIVVTSSKREPLEL